MKYISTNAYALYWFIIRIIVIQRSNLFRKLEIIMIYIYDN